MYRILKTTPAILCKICEKMGEAVCATSCKTIPMEILGYRGGSTSGVKI